MEFWNVISNYKYNNMILEMHLLIVACCHDKQLSLQGFPLYLSIKPEAFQFQAISPQLTSVSGIL